MKNELSQMHLNIRKIVQAVCLAVAISVPTHVAVFASETPPVHPGYPAEFDQTGMVDAASSKSFCIADITYRTFNETTFHGPNGRMSWRSFSVGDVVGVIMSENRMIQSVWLLAGESGKKRSLPEKSKISDKIYKEGDVWKN